MSESRIARLRLKVREHDEKVRWYSSLRLKVQNELAQLTCPYKVGDETTVKGFAFTGKRCKIMSIKPPAYDHHGDWQVAARLIKKDDTLGEVSLCWDECDEKRR